MWSLLKATLIIIIQLIHKSSANVSFSRDHVLVWFHPYVGADDYTGMYNALDLVPMVTRISTKFSKIMIESPFWSNENGGKSKMDSSVGAIPNAVALINSNQNNASIHLHPLEVYMTFGMSSQNQIHKQGNNELDQVIQLANEANAEFPGTVQRLVLNSTSEPDFQIVVKELKTARQTMTNITYKLGVMIHGYGCQFIINSGLKSILELVDIIFFKIPFDEMRLENAPHQMFQRHRQQYTECTEIVNKLRPDVDVGFITGWIPKSNLNTHDFQTQLGHYWKLNGDWAISTNTTICLYEAFDNPRRTKNLQNVGLWKLDESVLYHNSSQYVYYDKLELIESDNKQTPFRKAVQNQTTNMNREKVIVWVDPYITTADIRLWKNYQMNDILPLLETISTKFSKIMISSVTQTENIISNPIKVIPNAVAHINTRGHKVQPPLEVYMTFEGSPNDTHFGLRLADVANSKFAGTVQMLLFGPMRPDNAQSTLDNLILVQKYLSNSTFKYKLGLILDSTDSCRGDTLPDHVQEIPSGVQVLFFVIGIKSTDSVLNPVVEFKRIRRIFMRCQKTVQKLGRDIEVNLFSGWRENGDVTGVEINKSESRLATFWQLISDWAASTNTTVCLYEAFENKIKGNELKSMGLWKLQEDVVYDSRSEYIFVEKQGIDTYYSSLKPAALTNTTSLIEYKETNTTFSREHIAVLFDPYVAEADVNDLGNYQVDDVIPMINLVATKFSRILLKPVKGNFNGWEGNLAATVPAAVALINAERNPGERTLEVMLIFSDANASIANFKNMFEFAEAANSKFAGTVTQFLYSSSHTLNTTTIKAISAAKKHLKRGKNPYKLGIVMSDSDCHESSLNNQGYIAQALAHVKVVLVDSQIPDHNIYQGPKNMFEQILRTFNQCKSLLHKLNLQLEIGLSTGWPKRNALGDSDYESQLVDFWKLAGDWANISSTFVCLNQAFDTPYKQDLAEAGIWRLDETYLYDNPSQYVFIDKIRLAEQRKRESSESFQENHKWGTRETIVTVVCVTVFLVVVVGGVLLNRYAKLKSKRSQLTSFELDEFFDGDKQHEYGSKAEEICGLAYDEKLELSKDTFYIDTEAILGSGAFGVVYLGWVEMSNGTRKNVAVKTTKQLSHPTALKGLLSEIKVLSYLGNHENIVNIIGAYTVELKNEGTLYVFTELCALGSLQNYLRTSKDDNLYTDYLSCSVLSSEESQMNNSSQTSDYRKWATQIASGLEFIAGKQVVHADIATRNILLSADKTAKISDFGLSRRLYDYETYVKKQQEPLPWRWMAPEALRLHQFNEKTDVWAFGITLWEIYAHGSVPYPGLSWSCDFAQNLEQGLRVEKPPSCPNEMYNLILQCCLTNPTTRPTFTELKKSLEM